MKHYFISSSFAVDYNWAAMHFPIVVGISYLVVLTATISTSYEVSRFHWVMSNNGDVLCAASPPNKTLNAVRSRAHCIAQCNPPCSPSTCQNVNYWTNAKRCELFDYLPCSYDVRQDCTNYQVGTANKFWISRSKHICSYYDILNSSHVISYCKSFVCFSEVDPTCTSEES